MSLKPSDVFIGVTEFFSIMMPGALLSAALAESVSGRMFGPILMNLESEAARWAAFLVASYFLGHFAHMIGSYLDPLYNRYRQHRRPREKNHLYHAACALRLSQLSALGDSPDKAKELVNTFKWSKAFINLRSPAAAAEVARLEADSKFFRSAVVVLGVIAIVQGMGGQWVVAAVCGALGAGSFMRYADQRLKSTDQAYTYFLALRDQPAKGASGSGGGGSGESE